MSRRSPAVLARILGAALIGASLSGCLIGEDLQHGYVLDERTATTVKPGMSGEQVLSALGTPSTVSTVGNKSWYYINQRSSRMLMFMGQSNTDQKVLAVLFTPAMRVERVALYGLQDGRVFDFISRRTEAGGQESNFAAQLLRGFGSFIPNN